MNSTSRSNSVRKCICVGLLLGLVVLVNASIVMNRVRAQGDETYQAEMAKGNDFMRRRRYEDALKSFKRANDLRDKKSAESFYGMAQAFQALEAYKNVVESCEHAIEFAGSDAQLQAQAYNLEGIALQTQAAVKDQKKLQDAETAFRKALALNVALPIVHFNLGYTMMELGRDAEGTAELKKYIELDPNGSKAEDGAKLIENPRRAREAYAPDFSITTADGEYISLDDLKGKVVVLDFWGTWCPPCVSSVPALRDLQKRFAKEPLFKMISVSNDGDQAKWSDFIGKNQMTWTQYLDKDRHVVRAFDVRSYPTYILIDAEGVIRFRQVSTAWEHTGELPEAIKKQLKLATKSGSEQ